MPGRAARRQRNRELHVPQDVNKARQARKDLIRKWKKTTTESERQALAEDLLAAMTNEDDLRRPCEASYISWEERRRRNEPIACIPFSLAAWPGQVKPLLTRLAHPM
jgi:hypothetical protein